jgi:hypothetical protein
MVYPKFFGVIQMKKRHLPLWRIIFIGVALLVMFHLPGDALACCDTPAPANYYYIFTGFTGACVDGGGGNVVVNGTFLRLAYLPAVNTNDYTVTNPPFSGSFTLGAVGSATAGGAGSFLINHTSAPGPAPVSVVVTVNTSADGAGVGSTTATVTCSAIGAAPTVTTSHTYTALGGSGGGTVRIYDGRLNTDAAAPVILYPGSLRAYVYDPIACESILVLTITDEQIEAVGIPATTAVLGTAQNPLTGRTITIYRLYTGEFQMNTRYADGKLYVFTWNEDATSRYHPDY